MKMRDLLTRMRRKPWFTEKQSQNKELVENEFMALLLNSEVTSVGITSELCGISALKIGVTKREGDLAINAELRVDGLLRLSVPSYYADRRERSPFRDPKLEELERPSDA